MFKANGMREAVCKNVLDLDKNGILDIEGMAVRSLKNRTSSPSLSRYGWTS